MIDELEIAGHLVSQAIADRRVGTPVAARVFLAGVDQAHVTACLAEALDAACRWLGAEPLRLWARGGSATGHQCAQLLCRAGQSILAVVTTSAAMAPLELVVLGNRGVLHWNGDGETFTVPASSAVDSLSARGEQLRLAVEAAAISAQPVEVARAVRVGLPDLPAAASEAGESPPASAGLRHFSPVSPGALPLGVLLVNGNQSHQENYARSFAADARCRLIGLTDEPGLPTRRRELNAELAAELGIPLFDDFEAAIRRDDVRIISICASPERRARLIELCAATGKHLYLDKPLAASVEQSDSIVEAVRRGGGVSQMFSLVHTSLAARVRRVVESGAIGELRAIHCDAFFAKGFGGTAELGRPRRESRRPTNFELPEAKRELHNVGVYSLVLIHWLLGRDVRRVLANTANYFFAEHQRLDMEDYAHLTLELDGGVLATVATGRIGWRLHPMSGMNRVVLIGDSGVAAVDAFRPRLDVWSDEEPWRLPKRHPEDPMGFWTSTTVAAGAAPKREWITLPETTSDVRYFVDCIVAGRASDVPVELASHVMEVLMSAYESAATGQAVTLPIERSNGGS